MTAPTLQAIRYTRGSLSILNQLILPHRSEYVPLTSIPETHNAIRTMMVRGAPAIAIVAALGLAVTLHAEQATLQAAGAAFAYVSAQLEYLLTSRPTAVNLSDAARTLIAACAPFQEDSPRVISTYLERAEAMLEADVKDNMAIGAHGSEFIHNLATHPDSISLLTHCNTGSLATAGYGTALGVIRSVHASGHLVRAWHTETRPYLQGARLTAYELMHDRIPSTMIPDSAAPLLLSRTPIDAVVVGADRVAANGDTANKIGTLALALSAKHYAVPFIVCAPTTSIDLLIPDGSYITIEERPPQEMYTVHGLDPTTSALSSIHIADPAISVWNPSFDIVPASLITAIITEQGTLLPTHTPGGISFSLKTQLHSD